MFVRLTSSVSCFVFELMTHERNDVCYLGAGRRDESIDGKLSELTPTQGASTGCLVYRWESLWNEK